MTSPESRLSRARCQPHPEQPIWQSFDALKMQLVCLSGCEDQLRRVTLEPAFGASVSHPTHATSRSGAAARSGPTCPLARCARSATACGCPTASCCTASRCGGRGLGCRVRTGIKDHADGWVRNQGAEVPRCCGADGSVRREAALERVAQHPAPHQGSGRLITAVGPHLYPFSSACAARA